jgi:transcriptional regulator with XRE-family HTH domain
MKDTEDLPPLGKFIRETMNERNLSLRAVSKEANMSFTYLSQVINGKKTPELKSCNRIADYFGVPRIKIYQLAGYLDLNEDEEMIQLFKELMNHDPDFAEFFHSLIGMDPEEKSRLLRMLRAAMGK